MWAKLDIFVLTWRDCFSPLRPFVIARWIKSNVVRISVLFIWSGCIWCFKPYFNSSNFSVVRVTLDKFWTSSIYKRYNVTSLVRYYSFFSTVLMGFTASLYTFFLIAMFRIYWSIEDTNFCKIFLLNSSIISEWW